MAVIMTIYKVTTLRRLRPSQFGIVVLQRRRLQNSLPHWRCIRLYLPQRRITRLISQDKPVHLLLKEKAFIVVSFARNLDVLL